MQPISLKTSFLTFTLVVSASLTSGVVTACSNEPSQSQNQVPNTTATDASAKQYMVQGSMNHGSGMDHSMTIDLGAADANYDLRFIDAMKLHHQGAVAMAKEAQSQEIEQLQQWRQAWHGIPKPVNSRWLTEVKAP